MVWIKGAPCPEASDEEHIAFFEKVVSCSIPEENEDPELHEIIKSVQCHSKNHSRTCFKRRDDECRFGYPLPIATSTFVLRPLSAPEGMNEKKWKERATEIVKSVKDFVTETKDIDSYSVQDVLAACNVTEDKYREALGALCRRDQLILKRDPSEVWVNFYCPKLIRFWNGNTDCQYIFNPHAVAKYCVSYTAKAEKEMGDLMRKAQSEARSGNMDAVEELRHLGDVYLTHRQVSIMEAIYRLTHLELKHFTREVIFIPVDDSSYR